MNVSWKCEISIKFITFRALLDGKYRNSIWNYICLKAMTIWSVLIAEIYACYLKNKPVRLVEEKMWVYFEQLL